MNTYAYVDGFNLYFGALRGTHSKWLNIKGLLELIFPRCHFIKIKYFTAKVTARPSDPQQPVRQQLFLRALASLPEVELCVVLQKNATFYKHIRPNTLAKCQFPPSLTDAHGTFTKPPSW